MSNELKDIAERLHKDYEDEGWDIIKAEKRQGGGWNLEILPRPEEDKKQEGEND
ncbi:MAG: hypothetical protein J6W46_07380 [Spirochaetaceae bacterium]|nr:hypothetical protein [Spirochaetaceae bacterium]